VRKTILIVEDEPINSELLAHLLITNGYTVVQAKDGKAGAKILDGGLAPCLILTDWVMPGNGEELIKHLRASDVLITIPIIIMTSTPELTRTIQLHGITVVKKPALDETLLALVRKHAG
jgi:two-component system, chemotaxis family, chemotaxis protein CheY